MSDVLVLGGGIAGVSAAAMLADGASVTLLEAESALGYHASGRSAALYEARYGSPTVRALTVAAREGHEARGVLSPRGLLLVGQAGEGPGFEADRDSMALDEITPEAAREMIPILGPTITRAAFHDAALDIDTDRLIQTFASELRAAGGQIVTKAAVTAIARYGDRWQVTAGGQTYEADTLVNATGAWADQIAGMAGIAPIGLTPYRRSMARIPAPGGLDTRPWPILFGPGETWYAKPDAGALIVSPADEEASQPMDAWAEDMTIAEGLARYEAVVTEPVTRVLTTWAGLRTFAPDRALVLGPDPREPAFVWCAGQGGYGFQTAPAAAQLVADLVLGRPSTLPNQIVSALSPGRFA